MTTFAPVAAVQFSGRHVFGSRGIVQNLCIRSSMNAVSAAANSSRAVCWLFFGSELNCSAVTHSAVSEVPD